MSGAKKNLNQKNKENNLELVQIWQQIFQKSAELSESFFSNSTQTFEKQLADDHGVNKAFASLS